MRTTLRTIAAGAAACLVAAAASAQAPPAPPPRPDGRVSFFVTTDLRSPNGGESEGNAEFATAVSFRTPEVDTPGLFAGVDVRHTGYTIEGRAARLSIYDGFVGARLGENGRLRVRAGHLWLPDLGTAGSLAGGLFEFRSAPAGATNRIAVGVFGGAEPMIYEAGYAPGVRKYGGYVALDSGFLRRHVVGVATIKQGSATERTMLSVTNYVPAGKSFFAYQAMEYDLQGPADGTAKGGLTYFLVNARQSAGSRVELQGTYNRGRSINARQLTDDVLNGRPLTPAAVDGLRYETAGGRVSVRVSRGAEIYGGYARDRNNRDDAAVGRLTIGGYASGVAGSGIDVSGSLSRFDRPTGPYTSLYLSVGRMLGRSVYVSGDYSSSLAVVRLAGPDGVAIESRPWSRRLSGNVSATLSRHVSLLGVVDYTMDGSMTDLRVMTGLTYRIR